MVQTEQTGPEASSLVELVDGVYAWVQPDGTWWVNNAGAVAGEDGLLVVDTCANRTRTRRFLDALDRATDVPIRWAVNTHQHGDHTYGNSLLPDSAVLIGQATMREALLHDPVCRDVQGAGQLTELTAHLQAHVEPGGAHVGHQLVGPGERGRGGGNLNGKRSSGRTGQRGRGGRNERKDP